MSFHCTARNQKTQLLLNQFIEFCGGDKELEERCRPLCPADVCSQELVLEHLLTAIILAAGWQNFYSIKGV